MRIPYTDAPYCTHHSQWACLWLLPEARAQMKEKRDSQRRTPKQTIHVKYTCLLQSIKKTLTDNCNRSRSIKEVCQVCIRLHRLSLEISGGKVSSKTWELRTSLAPPSCVYGAELTCELVQEVCGMGSQNFACWIPTMRGQTKKKARATLHSF